MKRTEHFRREARESGKEINRGDEMEISVAIVTADLEQTFQHGSDRSYRLSPAHPSKIAKSAARTFRLGQQQTRNVRAGFATRPMNQEEHFRKPTVTEQALLERLIEADFPGREELAPMIHSILVRPLDGEGSLELNSQIPGIAPVVKRIPVEAEATDEDGVRMHVLLHVLNGRPIELEFFKEDGSGIKRLPVPSDFELIVLPPAPSGPVM
jgi:hypothetical protein